MFLGSGLVGDVGSAKLERASIQIAVKVGNGQEIQLRIGNSSSE